MDKTRIRALLDGMHLFALLDEQTRAALAECVTVRLAGFGDTIFDRDDVGDAMYVVASGKARVVGLDTAGEEVSLAVLEAGDHFGEIALLSDQPRTATVRAAEDMILLRLDRRDFLRVVERHPELRSAIERYLNTLGVQNFLKQFTVFGAAPSRLLRRLVNELEECRVSAGQTVVRQDDAGDRLYIVQSGVLDALKRDAQGERLVGQIGEGEYFGELALMTGMPRAATVIARSDCLLLALAKPSFERIMIEAPELKRRIEEHAAQYRAATGEKGGERAVADTPAAPPPAGPEPGTAEPAPTRPGLWRRLLRRYPFIPQHDETDCGAASLAMIAAYHRTPVGLARLRDMANVDADGANLWSVAQAAESLGFRARGLQLAFDALGEITLPAIVHWEGFHYIVLYEVNARGVLVADPGFGLRRLSVEEFRRGWTGRALELVPTAQLGRTERIKTSFERFKPLLVRHRGMLIEVLCASLVLNLFGLGIPLFTQTIVDRVVVQRSADLLNMLFGGMLLIAVFQAAITAIRRLLLTHVSTTADAGLFASFLQHIFTLPMRFFDLRRVGDVLSRVAENDKIRSALIGTIPGVVLDTLLAAGYLGLMAWYNSRLTLLVLAVAALFIALTLAFTPALRKNRREAFVKHTDAWSYIIESFTGVGTVKAMAVETNVRWKMESLMIESLVVGRKGAQIETAYSTVALFVQSIGAALFLWFGAREVLAQVMTVGQMLAFTTLAGSVMAPVLRLVDAWDNLLDFRIAVERMNDVFDARGEEQPGREYLHLRRVEGRIKLENVTFKYVRSQDKPTLAGVSVEIRPGERIAVVGRSGSGKSTLGKLVLGLYLPTTGRVFIDGHDMRTLARRSLRRRIGVVPQDVFLFSGTIRDNIALGDPDAPFEKVVRAARLAGAHEFISAMGMGFDTKVGERGMSVSGGQRQRIALARALLNEPDILILDEATSALDNESERAIQRNLDEQAGKRTTIVIAHRLSTVKNADRILVMDNGTIVEEGPHDRLVAEGGLYAALVGGQVSE